MLSIAIGSISIMITGYILKRYPHDLSMFESELLSYTKNIKIILVIIAK